jgi:hypothetical protein
MHKEELKNVPLNKIIPYAKNPRINKKAIDKVAESLKAHGYVKTSVGVDEDMVMLYGHTTCKALEKNGVLVVPEVSQITGLSPAQKISYRIADNKTSEYAKWDFDLLYENMKLLEVSKGFTGVDAMGMSAAEIASLRKAHEGTEEKPIPEVLETSIKVGDVIKLGVHVVCPNCKRKNYIDVR